MKKIILISVFIFSFVLCGVVLPEFAGVIPLNQAQAQTPPGESLDDSGFMFDLTPITYEKIAGSTRQGWIRQGINYIFERIVTVLAATIGGLSVLMMSYGGFLILSSAGNENQSQQGKNYIKYSIIGLAFALGAYVLVNAVQLLIRSIYA